MEDKDIIKGCKKRNKLAQKALYDKYSAKLFTLCLRYAKCKQDAEDIFQEAFVKVFDSINKYENRGNFEGWLRKIFANYALNYYRYDKTFFSIDDFDGGNINEQTSNFDRFTREELLDAINKLDDTYRIVFNMVEIEGFGFEEIATMMNISQTAVRIRTHRAKSALREMLLEKENYRKTE